MAKLSPTGDSLRAWHARTDEPATCSITTKNMDYLTFTHGNAKLKNYLLFSLPAGKTCPGASLCKSFVVQSKDGKRNIQDGKDTVFRCFAASQEAQYDGAFASRAKNLKLLVDAETTDEMADLINSSLHKHRRKTEKIVRIHPSGDFFSRDYLLAWIKVAERNPGIKFYCYSKSLYYFIETDLPDNFYLTASKGGVFDHLIDEGFFSRYAVVVKTEEEAAEAGLEIDHDDSHCFGDKPFALLVHGTQPKGSEWGAAIRERRKTGKFSGYSKTTNEVAELLFN